MKVTIFTVAYDNDLEFLKYNLKSIDKFCKGYHKNIVLLDRDNSCSKTIEYLDSINQPYFVDVHAAQIKNGYVRQQYIKFKADEYMPEGCEYICWVDSDNIFTKKHTPDVYFNNEKPVILKNSYKNIYKKLREEREPERAERDLAAFNVWQETTSELVGFDVQYEYMQSMPFVYPMETQKRFRDYLENLHGMSLLKLIKNQTIMADANVIGAYCERYEKDKFHFIDRNNENEFKEFIQKRRSFFAHYSSRKEGQPERYVDLSKEENILSKLIN
jgi:hypothetical protein